MSQTAAAVAITLDPSSDVPVWRQIYERVRDAALSGQLGAGVRLPATRTLAAELGVSRTTAVAAYERLRNEGYLDGRVGAGTTVARLLTPLPHGPQQAARAAPLPARLSAQGARLARVLEKLDPGVATTRRRARAFPVGRPALDAFPSEVWGRTIGSRARAARGG